MMLKKPEKKHMCCSCDLTYEEEYRIEGFNQALDLCEAYYAQEGMVKLSSIKLNEEKVLEIMSKILDNPNEEFMNWREVVASALASKSSELLEVDNG